MRRARAAVVAVSLLLLAQSAGGGSRATGIAGASVTIINASAADVQLPERLSVSTLRHHALPIGRALPATPPSRRVDIRSSSSDVLIRVRDLPSGQILEIDLLQPAARDITLPLEVTYHQY